MMATPQRLFWLALVTTTAYSFFLPPPGKQNRIPDLRASNDGAPEALQRTAAHLEKLKRSAERRPDTDQDDDPFAEERETLYRTYLQRSANSLKDELKSRGLRRTGRKPDLASRLAEYDLQSRHGVATAQKGHQDTATESPWTGSFAKATVVQDFAGIVLSEAAGQALGSAGFEAPSPIQVAAIPSLTQGESVILHAETGSGKTLAYLLPFTETLWLDQDEEHLGYTIIMTPTRELAAQVAGVATVLSPPGSVRFVSRATNLMSDGLKERGELEYGGRLDDAPAGVTPRLFVGSAKAIMHSLYGDGVMPASPTTKPEAMFLLRNVKSLVLDEVDRLLHVQKSRSDNSKRRHEKPAAVVASAVARLTLGRAQIVAASATVGRPLKREMTRVLGLAPQDCPRVIRAEDGNKRTEHEQKHMGRAVTIPSTVRNYVLPVDGSSVGNLLTSAFRTIQRLSSGRQRRILLVLTRGCGINTKNAIGALKHFRCQPEPQSLLDALEASGTDRLIQVHREVSGATGLGESSELAGAGGQHEGYLLVTGEDSVRGLHLDGLDTVILVGRPHGPDEYTHIAGRTGRAGQTGSVISVVSDANAAALRSWERMLEIDFERLQLNDLENLE